MFGRIAQYRQLMAEDEGKKEKRKTNERTNERKTITEKCTVVFRRFGSIFAGVCHFISLEYYYLWFYDWPSRVAKVTKAQSKIHIVFSFQMQKEQMENAWRWRLTKNNNIVWVFVRKSSQRQPVQRMENFALVFCERDTCPFHATILTQCL